MSNRRKPVREELQSFLAKTSLHRNDVAHIMKLAHDLADATTEDMLDVFSRARKNARDQVRRLNRK